MPACPECGHNNEGDAVICASCDYILDSGFLGDDILDERSQLGDAVILGNLDADFESGSIELDFSNLGDSGEVTSFLTAATQEMRRVVMPFEAYIGGGSKGVLGADAVAEQVEGFARDQLSPQEVAVLDQIDGIRPLARVAKRVGMSDRDVMMTAAILSDRGAIVRVGTAEDAQVFDDDDAHKTLMTMRVVTRTGFDDEASDDRFEEETFFDADKNAPDFELTRDTVVESAPRVSRSGSVKHYAELARIRTREAANEVPPVLGKVATLVHAAKDHERLGQYEQTVEILNKALELRPTSAPLHNQLGVILATRLKRFSDALEHLETATTLAPDKVAYARNYEKVKAEVDR